MIYDYHGQRNNGTGYYTIRSTFSCFSHSICDVYSIVVLDFLLGFISVTENAKTDWLNPPGGQHCWGWWEEEGFICVGLRNNAMVSVLPCITLDISWQQQQQG